MMKKTFLIVLAAILLVFMPQAASAKENIKSTYYDEIKISPLYVFINDASCSLTISGGGTAYMSADIQCVSIVNKIRIIAYLQKYDGGWHSISGWSQYYYSKAAAWARSYNVQSGYNYRLFVYFYVYNGSILLESATRSDIYWY
jgi:hypothetical protein